MLDSRISPPTGICISCSGNLYLLGLVSMVQIFELTKTLKLESETDSRSKSQAYFMGLYSASSLDVLNQCLPKQTCVRYRLECLYSVQTVLLPLIHVVLDFRWLNAVGLSAHIECKPSLAVFLPLHLLFKSKTPFHQEQEHPRKCSGVKHRLMDDVAVIIIGRGTCDPRSLSLSHLL